MDKNTIDFLKSVYNFSSETINDLLNISEFKKIKAGTNLIKLREVPSKIFMLTSGVVRCYINTESGKEFNKNFFLPVNFISSLRALITRTPSDFVFESLTDIEVYEVDYFKFIELRKKDKAINDLYIGVLEKTFIKYEKRLIELISLDAKDRYLQMLQQIPNIEKLVPQYHIASYLGITAVQLSRIKKKIDLD